MASRPAGTDDMIGATITAVDSYAGTYGYIIQAEKNGITYELSAEEQWDTCMCDEHCYCSPSISYRATASVE